MPVKRIAVFAAVVLATGCTGLAGKLDANFERSENRATALIGSTGRAVPSEGNAATPLVVHEDGIWIGRSVVKLGAKPLPPIFYEPATFDRNVASLAEFAERISMRSGIPVRIAPEVKGSEGGSPEAPAEDGPRRATAAAGAATVAGAALARPDARAAQRAGSPGAALATGPVRITYSSGNFKGLLDAVASRFGVSWKYGDGAIDFFLTEARTFQISSVPGDSAFSANVVSGATSTGGVSGGAGGSGGANGGGGGGSSSGINANNSQNTTVAARLSVYSSIESTIKAMLSQHGKVTASPATGAITVIDTPESLNRIAAYVENENKMLSRQVVINVTVLSVSLSDSDAYGINWNLVYNTLNRQYGITNRFATTTGSTQFSASVIGSSQFAGSSAVIEALSKQGKVRRQTTASVVTLNNQPVPVQVAKQTSYLQSSQTSVVAQVGTVTTLTPGIITSGFNMSILPYVLANGTVMLQFSSDLSTLRQIRSIESTGSKIEMPEIDTRNFLQRVAMKSNETLIISGFEQTDENLDNQGVGHPKNLVLGGSANASRDKEIIVILITPSTVAGT
jgi:type IVB pilus formation R64 PilN family outer membrane protein